jgi:hypothetical protein
MCTQNRLVMSIALVFLGAGYSLCGCMFEPSGAETNSSDSCGNGVVDPGEACDATQFNGQTCHSEGYVSGTLACTVDCMLDTSGCVSENCGNGNLDPGEACDGVNLDGNDCTTVGGGFTDGVLACTTSCTFDTSGCSTEEPCGNGQIDPGEECDGSNLAGATCTTVDSAYSGGTLGCNAACQPDGDVCADLMEGQDYIGACLQDCTNHDDCRTQNTDSFSCLPMPQGWGPGGDLVCRYDD